MSWITAEAALAQLQTKPQTLYANVSRGRIQSRPDPADSRRSLYRLEDVERLAQRRPGPGRTATVASQTITWGEPVMPTAISTIADGRLYYRGKDAVGLSQTMTLEAVAGLLWACADPDFGGGTETESDSALSALAGLANRQLPTLGRTIAVLRGDAIETVNSLAMALTGSQRSDWALHLRLAHHWRRPDSADMLRRALVLLAEHELNASTFAVRVAASTGASLSAATLAGIAALGGPLHGGAAVAMRDLSETAEHRGAPSAINVYLQQGRPVPCVGHRLYPMGDIRARALMDQFDLPPIYAELDDAIQSKVGEQPNIDFALTALAAAFDLPDNAPLTLFTLGRSIGWLAHALEQVGTGTLIRPRANYVGEPINLI
ncbi:citrate synthase [Devosia rhodophyticola]|uniref:citrate synthase (unknown stereospecificity) n=1 Tax=Devosia rhodophyticola TaxID=3026423 RepID=A0ABY7Z146_9HYPH|nr:citrate synthase [Devosia rhodophyticola]WDR07202.1 citrate synthase [Devosia rhodophyticola]